MAERESNPLEALTALTGEAELADEVLNVEQAAKLLRIGEHEVRGLVKGGRLPGFRLGNGWKFSKRVLLEWVRQNCWQTLEPTLTPERGR